MKTCDWKASWRRFLFPVLALALGEAAGAASEAPVRVEIANGHGVPDVAEEASAYLDENPFDVVRVVDAPSFKYGQTFILYRPGFAATAETLAGRLPVKGLIRQSGGLDDDVDIRLLLGRDFAFQAVRAKEAARRAEEARLATLKAQAAERAPRIELSNGNGVAGMASRVEAWLRERDVPVYSLTNADSYDYARTVIFHRSGMREAAEALAGVLPVGGVRLEENDRQDVDLRLVIGGDFVSYDINRLRPGS